VRIPQEDYEAYEFVARADDEEADGIDDESRQDCDGCRFWSECCAQSIGCGPMQALCLNSESPKYSRMTGSGCNKYRAGRAVDDPSR
jgi:hypothetical protein